jgi:O-antigen/teichoic acid export membrane protein
MNFATQIAISALAVIAIPTIVHGLGDERFGLLSVCWLLLGYVGFLDLGMGQATVNLLASKISEGKMEEAGRVLRTAFVLGIALSIAFIVLFETLYELGLASFLNLSPAIMDEARISLQLFAIGIPPVLLMGILRSVPLSMNRFDLVNLLQTLGAALQWLGSIAVIYLGGSLVEVIALFVATRYLIAGLLYLYVRRIFPSRSGGSKPAGESPLRRLLAFGGWVSIAQLIGPLLLVLERVIISRTSSPEWITYFAIPQDTMLKLVIIPMSLASTLYPVVSARWGMPDGAAFSRRIYHDSVRYTYYMLIPVIFIGVVFSRDILRIWLGDAFAERSGEVFAMVAFGVLFHALAQLPNTLILGSGRPQITAKLLLVELVPYLALCYWFTSMWGVWGTGLAWLLRVVIETTYLFLRVRGLWEGTESIAAYSYLWKGAVLLVCCGLPVLGARYLGMGTITSVAVMAGFMVVYSVSLWFVVFDNEDRGRLLGVFRPAGTQG